MGAVCLWWGRVAVSGCPGVLKFKAPSGGGSAGYELKAIYPCKPGRSATVIRYLVSGIRLPIWPSETSQQVFAG